MCDVVGLPLTAVQIIVGPHACVAPFVGFTRCVAVIVIVIEPLDVNFLPLAAADISAKDALFLVLSVAATTDFIPSLLRLSSYHACCLSAFGTRSTR